MSRARIEQRRKLRYLAQALLTRARDVKAQVVLVASVDAGDGRTLLLNALRTELRAIAPGRVAAIAYDRLREMSPEELLSHELVLIDGPPATGSDTLLDTPREWLDVIDGSVLVVVKRRSRRKATRQATAWLESLGLPVIGVVYNEHVLPEPWLWARQVKRTLLSWVGVRSHKTPIRDGADP